LLLTGGAAWRTFLNIFVSLLDFVIVKQSDSERTNTENAQILNLTKTHLQEEANVTLRVLKLLYFAI